jgi:hypothetical protein
MVKLLKLKDKINYRVKRSKNSIFLLKDFDDLSGRDQVGRVLRNMIKQGLMVKLGFGIYSRAKKSRLSGDILPEKGLMEGGKEALAKLNIKTYPSAYETMYNNFQSTQVPTGRVIGVKNRISRKLSYGGYNIWFEKLRA